MFKFRKAILFLFFFAILFQVRAQNDTIIRRGFTDFQEASDTLFARLMAKKSRGVLEFTVSMADFTKETRKADTVIPVQMIRGQYISYWGRVDRTFKKVYKKLRKRRISSKRVVYDTILVYRNTGNPNIHRVELYFSQRRYKGYVKFQIWRVSELWYFSGKFELVEEQLKK